MSMVNQFQLFGNAGKDPEVSTTSTGKPVLTLSLAVNKKSKKENGELVERTNWFNLTVYSEKLIEVFKNGVKKGTSIAVTGELRTDSYTSNKFTDPDGNFAKIYTTSFIVQEMRFLGNKKPEDSTSGDLTQSEGVPPEIENPPTFDDDDDIPF